MADDPDPQTWAESQARNAILLKRVYPPRHELETSSYFGGLPTLPASMSWPNDSRSGEAMSFLGQIDCSQLPDCPGERALPREGLLSFFASPGDGTSESRVLFSADGPGACSEVRAPHKLMHCYGMRRCNSALASGLGGVFPKWAVEPQIRRTFPGEASAEHFFYVDLGRIDGDPFVYARACASAEQENLTEIFGAPVTGALPELPIQELWWPDDAFPYAWIQLQACLEELLENLARKAAGSAADGQDKRATEAKAWIGRAQEAGLFEPVPDEMRREFRDWIESLQDRPDAQAGGLLPSEINSCIYAALEETCDLCLSRSRDAAALIPAEIVANQSYRHASFATFGGNARNQLHQMLGHGKGVQAAPETHKDDVLLMQFDTDAGMHWTWGDNGILQFWIKPEDLQARRFDRVVMTADCY